MPLGLSAIMHTAQAAGRRMSTQHGTKKGRMTEMRLGKRGRGRSPAERVNLLYTGVRWLRRHVGTSDIARRTRASAAARALRYSTRDSYQ